MFCVRPSISIAAPIRVVLTLSAAPFGTDVQVPARSTTLSRPAPGGCAKIHRVKGRLLLDTDWPRLLLWAVAAMFRLRTLSIYPDHWHIPAIALALLNSGPLGLL